MSYIPQESAVVPLTEVVTASNNAELVRVYPPEVDRALGRMGVTSDTKFGYTVGLGTAIILGTPSTWVDLWAYGGLRTSPTTTFTPYMASTDSGDTDIDVVWTYLDAAGVEQSVTVATDATNGTTPVSLGVTAQELYRGSNASSTALVGDVACATTNAFTAGSPTNQDEVLAVIPATDGQTQVLARRIPAGKQAVVRGINLYGTRRSGGAGSVSIVLEVRENGGVWLTERSYSLSTASPIRDNTAGLVLPPLADFRVRIRDVSDSGTDVSGSVVYDLLDV